MEEDKDDDDEQGGGGEGEEEGKDRRKCVEGQVGLEGNRKC